jgi:CubicO group peptidase (beta-lactamase class C family)
MSWTKRKVLQKSSIVLFTLVLASSAQQQERKVAAVDTKILDGYAGRYEMAPTFIITITRDGDHLLAQATGQRSFAIFPESEKEFFAKAPPIQISFTTGDDGTATEVVVHQNGRNTRAKRIVQLTAASLQSRLAEIDAFVASDFARSKVGSVTAGVVSGKDLVWTKSYGNADMEKKAPADKDTVYRIGSITKMFTAVMLEQLVESGKVHYSDPVEKYFPEIKTVPGRFPDAPPITLIQLVTHTSGLGREPDDTDTYVSGGPPAAWEKTLIAALPHTRYQLEPGTHFFYSNIGLAVLGAALGRAAGQPYMEYVPKRIFTPLGMTHSVLETNDTMLAHLAKGYQSGPKGVDSETPQREHAGRGYKMPNGAIYTTVGDLARFASLMLGEGPETVLKSVGLQRMLGSAVPSNVELSSGYGHGFEVSRRDNYVSFGHSGAVAGYVATLHMNRKRGIAVIVLANSTGTPLDPSGLATRALDLLSK